MPLRNICSFAPALLLCGLASAPAMAEPTTAESCIEFTPVRDVSRREANEYKGWLKNTCDTHVSVIHGFDRKFDGTPKKGQWCRPGNEWGKEHFPNPDGHMLDPGETQGVGNGFETGVGFKISWAACKPDTSANNSVNFLIEPPIFRFKANCDYECE